MFSFLTRPISPAERGGCRELFITAGPLIMSMAADTVMQFTDRVFLGKYSDTSLMAALPAGVLSYVLMCLFHHVAAYAGTFVAQYHGAKSPAGCLHATAQGLWLSLFTYPLMLATIPIGYLLINASGHGANVIAEEKIYFLILMLGGIRLTLSSAISGYFTGRNLLKVNTIANIVAMFVNVPLDYALIFGFEPLGIPRLGIAGAAIATVIAGFVPFIIQFAVYLRANELKNHGLRAAFRLDWPLMRRLIRFGLPSGLQTLVDVGAFAFFIFLTGHFDGVKFIASNMCMSINHLAFAPLMGFGIAASMVVGRYQGARESVAALRSGWSALKMAWCYMVPLAVLFAVFPGFFIGLLHSNTSEYARADLMQVAAPMLLMMAIWGLGDAVNIVFMSALKGAGDTHFIMYFMLLSGWLVWIPAELIAIKVFHADILTAWGIFTAYIIGLALVFLIRWQRGKWTSIQVIEPVQIIPPQTDLPIE